MFIHVLANLQPGGKRTSGKIGCKRTGSFTRTSSKATHQNPARQKACADGYRFSFSERVHSKRNKTDALPVKPVNSYVKSADSSAVTPGDLTTQ